ncbi:hypothetical protein BST61_g5031 [Cercospora zeina]
MRTHQLSVAGGRSVVYMYTMETAGQFHLRTIPRDTDVCIAVHAESVRRAAKRCIIISSNALLRPGRTSRVA